MKILTRWAGKYPNVRKPTRRGTREIVVNCEHVHCVTWAARYIRCISPMTADQSGADSDSGSLSATPFIELCLRLYRRRGTGQLRVQPRGGREYSLDLTQGRVTGAWIPGGDTNSLDRALSPLCALEDGQFTFCPGVTERGPGHRVAGVVDPFAFATRGLREHAPEQAVERTMQRYDSVVLRVRPGIDIGRFGLDRHECALLDVLRAEPVTGRVALSQSPLPVGRTKRVLYLLMLTDVLAPYSEVTSSRPSHTRLRSGSQSSSSSLPARPGQAAPASGRPQTRVVGAPGQPAASSMPAWKQLVSRPPASARRRHPTPASWVNDLPVEALDDTGKLRRAIQLGERGHWERGVEIVRELRARDRNNANYAATEAWLLYLPERGAREHSRELAEAVYFALRMDNQNPRALYTKGLMLKEQGRIEESLEYLRRACGVDPRILGREDPLRIACERELRIAGIRRRHRR